MALWIRKSPIILILICLSAQAALTPPTLETERCLLRPLALSDAPSLFLLSSDAHVSLYTGIFKKDPYQKYAATHAFIQRCLQAQINNRGMHWVIVAKSNNAVIGFMTLCGYSKKHRKAELGYALSPAYWGMGIMTEVSKAFITFAFMELNLLRLQATVDPENVGSERVLIKCGMQYEGLLRNYYMVHGESRNRTIYALTREDFFMQHSEKSIEHIDG